MNKLLLSAAALTLLALPALAQQPNGFDLTHGGAQSQQRAAPAAQAAPQQRGGGDHGGNRGGDRGGNRGAPAAAAAPAAQPQQDRHVGGAWGHGGPGFTPGAQNQNQNRPGDANRNGFDQRGQGGNRNGFNNGGRDDHRGGYDNNRGNNSRGYGNSGRRDYRSFNNYHRSYNASRRFRAPAYRRPSGWYDRRWTFGEFLPSLFWSSNYWLNDYNTYDLPPPPYGAVWVRNGNDALLIDRDSGEIISIEYGVFY